MTIQECYQRLGGNYAQAEQRLMRASLVERFALRFLDDHSFDELCQAMDKGSRSDAFRAAHTLKGVSANLSFTQLFTSSDALTELLRPEADAIPADAFALLENVKQDYKRTVEAIQAFRA
ncbi:MAG: Hpt domain-containing protein [Aristaeellaceae bacterium]